MHQTETAVRWSELDPYAHVNHAVYLTYLETARIEALESIGWSMNRLSASGHLVLVADIHVRFRKAAVEGDLLEIRTIVTGIKAASVRWHQWIDRGDETLLTADLVAAVTDTAGRPRRVPPDLAEDLRRLMEA